MSLKWNNYTNKFHFERIRFEICEYTNFGKLSEGHEALSGIYSYWQRFAGNDVQLVPGWQAQNKVL